MSTWYSLSVKIDAPFNHKVVEQILKIGQELTDAQGKFGKQLQVAREYNMIFEVHSKQLVPEVWKKWFELKNILH